MGSTSTRGRERKRPKSGWANYCDDCSKNGVAQQRAALNYREKVAHAVRLHLAGVSVQEIAKELKANAVRVKKWLKKEANGAQTKARK